MKFIWTLLLICVTAHAEQRFVIGLTPYLDKSNKDEVYRRIVGMVLEDMPLDSSLAIFDAYNLKTVAKVDVPAAQIFKSGKARANQFKEPIQKLREFLAADQSLPAATNFNLAQAIRLPQFMDFVADHFTGTNAVRVIVIGSPLYLDPKEPGFSMLDGYFPSDGHLLATREDSVFGLKGHESRLQNVSVHFGYFGDPWVSAVHQEKVERFWSLYLQEQGARLATFCGDLPTLFAAAKTDATRPARFEIDRKQTKVEMLRISRDLAAADWITRDTLSNPRPAPPNKTVGPMKIGIRWKGDIDLDLYASPTRDGETLSFEHTRIAEGYYFKDHRHSPEREFEFIEFEAPVDVWRVDANINFYQGDADGKASGEIRIEFDGKIYSSRFMLAANHGNKGRTGTRQADFWTRIDVPGVLGLDARR